MVPARRFGNTEETGNVSSIRACQFMRQQDSGRIQEGCERWGDSD